MTPYQLPFIICPYSPYGTQASIGAARHSRSGSSSPPSAPFARHRSPAATGGIRFFGEEEDSAAEETEPENGERRAREVQAGDAGEKANAQHNDLLEFARKMSITVLDNRGEKLGGEAVTGVAVSAQGEGHVLEEEEEEDGKDEEGEEDSIQQVENLMSRSSMHRDDAGASPSHTQPPSRAALRPESAHLSGLPSRDGALGTRAPGGEGGASAGSALSMSAQDRRARRATEPQSGTSRPRETAKATAMLGFAASQVSQPTARSDVSGHKDRETRSRAASMASRRRGSRHAVSTAVLCIPPLPPEYSMIEQPFPHELHAQSWLLNEALRKGDA